MCGIPSVRQHTQNGTMKASKLSEVSEQEFDWLLYKYFPGVTTKSTIKRTWTGTVVAVFFIVAVAVVTSVGVFRIGDRVAQHFFIQHQRKCAGSESANIDT